MLVLLLIFREYSISYSIDAEPFCIPSHKKLFLLHIPKSTYVYTYIFVFIEAILTGMRWYTFLFWFEFPW